MDRSTKIRLLLFLELIVIHSASFLFMLYTYYMLCVKARQTRRRVRRRSSVRIYEVESGDEATSKPPPSEECCPRKSPTSLKRKTMMDDDLSDIKKKMKDWMETTTSAIAEVSRKLSNLPPATGREEFKACLRRPSASLRGEFKERFDASAA